MKKIIINSILMIIFCFLSLACGKGAFIAEGKIKSIKYISKGVLSPSVTILTFENGQTITIEHNLVDIPDTINTWKLYEKKGFNGRTYEWKKVD